MSLCTEQYLYNYRVTFVGGVGGVHTEGFGYQKERTEKKKSNEIQIGDGWGIVQWVNTESLITVSTQDAASK